MPVASCPPAMKKTSPGYLLDNLPLGAGEQLFCPPEVIASPGLTSSVPATSPHRARAPTFPLNLLLFIDICLILEGPKLDTVLYLWSDGRTSVE